MAYCQYNPGSSRNRHLWRIEPNNGLVTKTAFQTMFIPDLNWSVSWNRCSIYLDDKFR